MSANPSELAHKTIDELYAKYAADEHLFSKVHNFICFRVPQIVDEMKRISDERRARNEHLTSEQDTFIERFLTKHQYFHCPQTNCFFSYDGSDYCQKKEDDILHHVLTSITREGGTLMQRKPQTKMLIMKRIKERSLFTSIPESKTIQSVLDALSPALFQSKSHVKYFLTILGDHLLKKTDDVTHSYFATSKSKQFLRELAIASQSFFNVSATGLFKHKYHGHAFETVRLIKMNETVSLENIWQPIFAKHLLNILCVSAHYSERYGSADQFLDNHSDDAELVQYAMFFRGKTPHIVVQEFVKSFLKTASHTATLSLRTVDYLWRKYLRDSALPNVITPQTAMELLQQSVLRERFDEGNQCFVGVTSAHLPVIQQFESFWNETMQMATATGEEYEIDELVMLFRDFSAANGQVAVRISDQQMLELIRTYSPVEIVEDKYIYGIKCAMWDKPADLQSFLEEFVEHRTTDVSVNDAYGKYQQWVAAQSNRRSRRRVVGKLYFERFIMTRYKSHLHDVDGVLWLSMQSLDGPFSS